MELFLLCGVAWISRWWRWASGMRCLMDKGDMSRFLVYRAMERSLNGTWNSMRNEGKTRICTAIRGLGSSCQETPNIRIRIARPVDYDRLIDFMRDTYFKNEPSLVNIGLAGCADPPPELIHLMREQLREGMTIIAETPDNCVLGAAVNAGCCPWDPARMIEFAERCCQRGPTRDLIKFFAHVTGQPRLWDRYCTLKIFDCCHLSVDPRCFGKGIGRRLVSESWHLARDCGYKLFRIDCTSSYTAKIAEGFGWECVFSKPYRRHVESGSLVFNHIQEPHTEIRVFVDQPLISGRKDHCASHRDHCKISSTPKVK